MKNYLFVYLWIFPLCVFPQTRIDISPCFEKDSSKVSYWMLNGKRIDSNDFPVFVTRTNNRIDTIVFVHDVLTEFKNDTVFVLFPKKDNLLLVPDNDGSFDIIQKHPKKRSLIKAKFIVQNIYSDTIICCYSSETALVGQLFKKSGSSGWLKPFSTPYQSNIIHICVFKAKQLNYYDLDKEDALLFGDNNCSIVGWDIDQISNLHRKTSYKIRLFERKKIFFFYDNDTNQGEFSISKIKITN